MMAMSGSKKWRKRWYVAGSLLVVSLLILLALNPESAPRLNSVSIDLRRWKLSNTIIEKPEREGRIHVTRTICVGPITYRGQSYDSVMAREERSARRE